MIGVSRLLGALATLTGIGLGGVPDYVAASPSISSDSPGYAPTRRRIRWAGKLYQPGGGAECRAIHTLLKARGKRGVNALANSPKKGDAARAKRALNDLANPRLPRTRVKPVRLADRLERT